jgi:hypothetical protein
VAAEQNRFCYERQPCAVKKAFAKKSCCVANVSASIREKSPQKGLWWWIRETFANGTKAPHL